MTARGLDTPRHAKETKETVEPLKNSFNQPANAGGLLVLDNANDVDLVRRLIPTARRSRVPLTTNEPAARRIAGQELELNSLGPDEGAAALLALYELDDSASVADCETARDLGIGLVRQLLDADPWDVSAFPATRRVLRHPRV